MTTNTNRTVEATETSMANRPISSKCCTTCESCTKWLKEDRLPGWGECVPKSTPNCMRVLLHRAALACEQYKGCCEEDKPCQT